MDVATHVRHTAVAAVLVVAVAVLRAVALRARPTALRMC